MASEWEELESWSKEDLIIELLKERNLRRQSNRAIRSIIDLDYPEDRRLPVYEDDGTDGEVTTDEWARRIIAHVWRNTDDPDYFDVETCQKYGLDSDQFDRVGSEMAKEGLVRIPGVSDDV